MCEWVLVKTVYMFVNLVFSDEVFRYVVAVLRFLLL
jgi:hypothetical protein